MTYRNIGDHVTVNVLDEVPSWTGKIVGTATMHRAGQIVFAYVVEPFGGHFDMLDCDIRVGCTSSVVCVDDVLTSTQKMEEFDLV